MWNTNERLREDFPDNLDEVRDLLLSDAILGSLLLEYEELTDIAFLADSGISQVDESEREALAERIAAIRGRIAEKLGKR
ncbi:hypothetical protein NN6n1_00210 [Shinella zoogloeoides]